MAQLYESQIDELEESMIHKSVNIFYKRNLDVLEVRNIIFRDFIPNIRNACKEYELGKTNYNSLNFYLDSQKKELLFNIEQFCHNNFKPKEADILIKDYYDSFQKELNDVDIIKSNIVNQISMSPNEAQFDYTDKHLNTDYLRAKVLNDEYQKDMEIGDKNRSQFL